MRILISALSGSLFGLGLLVSGMTDTAKVQGWLDLFGHWDPTLAFVLGGAVLPMVGVWRIAAKRGRALTGDPIPPMPSQLIDGRLIAGSALFGIGWALAGFCPGPAIAAAAWSGPGGLTFLVAMLAGFALYGLYGVVLRRRQRLAVPA